MSRIGIKLEAKRARLRWNAWMSIPSVQQAQEQLEHGSAEEQYIAGEYLAYSWHDYGRWSLGKLLWHAWKMSRRESA